MDISHRIVIQTLLFFVLFILDLGEGQDGCPVLRCGEYGPDIRFPFRFKDRQPDHCGYPGFDLYCNDKNDTVLKLPTSIITFVNSIDYESQFIKVTVSDVYCFPRDILNLSSSPFQFQDFLYDYALFNCTGTRETGVEHYSRIDCLSSSRHPVYAFRPDDNIDYLPILSCTKMYTVSSVAYVWDDYSVEWRWSEPKCGFCERKGEKCRFKNNTKIFETECFNLTRNKYKDNKGIVFYPISAFIITQVLHVSSQHKLAIVGLWCIQWHPVDHPSMKVVVQMLEREGDNLTMPPNPFASTGYTRINASTLAWRLNLDLEVIPELELFT
ncbi:ring-h2 finger protein atl22 [Quercus suber]|uniref:RING-type E3 ubiquitin transferase n=1 Tax=Quercus suber TaxID=58331 RepID=A0AAW0JJV4_QUESU